MITHDDGAGPTLVLRDPLLDGREGESWGWSAAVGGTPGAVSFETVEPRPFNFVLVHHDVFRRWWDTKHDERPQEYLDFKERLGDRMLEQLATEASTAEITMHPHTFNLPAPHAGA